MRQLKLTLFGTPQLLHKGQPVEISLRKGVALLAYLAVNRQPQSRDALATLLWPESDQSGARANLRRTLYRLNQGAAADLLDVTAESIGIQPQADLWLDVAIFRQMAAACLPEADAVRLPSPDCLAQLETAVSLYQDDFLAGFTLPDSPAFDEWQFFQRESLRQLLARMLQLLVDAYQQQQQFEDAIPYARRWLVLDPLHEPAQRTLMELYALAGQHAAALRQYDECVRLLAEELDLAPEPETTAVYEAIRTKQITAKEFLAPKLVSLPIPTTSATSETAVSPTTQYVRSGDVHIAYQVFGSGAVDLLLVGGFVSHLEYMWAEPRLAGFLTRLGENFRVIAFDKRGVGLSDRVGYPPCLDHTMDDMNAVLDAVGAERPLLLGVSEGGPNSILFAATYPERVAGLVLYGTMAKGSRSPDYPWAMPPHLYDRWLDEMVSNWGQPLNIDVFAPSLVHDQAFRDWWAHMLRLSSSPGGVQAVLAVLRDIDVRHVLPAVHVPALILHRRGDQAVWAGGARMMAQQMPDARYVELPGQDHWWWVGDSEAILAEIEQFGRRLRPSSQPERMLGTLLMAEPLPGADEDLLQAFYDMVQEEQARYRGREMATENGAVLLFFDGPSRALQCARAVRAFGQQSGLPIRAGLHTGECEMIDGQVQGVALEIATSIKAQAEAGEVLVPRTVADLVVGSGFSFEDRGLFALADVAEWRLFALA